MASEHTPGPLEAVHFDGPDEAATGQVRKVCDGRIYNLAICRHLGDAILYAAAPELLEACKAILPHLPTEADTLNYASMNDGVANDWHVAAAQVRAAIAKAKQTSGPE